MGELDLLDVYDTDTWGAPGILYELLKERDFATSISHKRMPAYNEHLAFVNSRPYHDWCLIRQFRKPIYCDVLGAVYLTDRNEIGIQIFKAHQRKGYGEWAVHAMMARHPEVKRFLANINPRNGPSQALFGNLGFSLCQWTYEKVMDEPDVRGPSAGVSAPAGDDGDPETRPG